MDPFIKELCNASGSRNVTEGPGDLLTQSGTLHL